MSLSLNHFSIRSTDLARIIATLVNELFNSIAVHSTNRSIPIQKSFETYVVQLSENPDSFWRLIEQFQRQRPAAVLQ